MGCAVLRDTSDDGLDAWVEDGVELELGFEPGDLELARFALLVNVALLPSGWMSKRKGTRTRICLPDHGPLIDVGMLFNVRVVGELQHQYTFPCASGPPLACPILSS